MPTRHEFGGFLVESAIPLTAIRQVSADPGCPPDVLIRVADTEPAPTPVWRHHWLHADQSESLALSVEAGRYRLRVPGLCDFVLDQRARSLCVSPLCELDPWTREHLLLDQILPRWFALAGHIVLHAALVDVGGAGVLLLGDSGAGKSTLAALLHASGHPVLSDDAVMLDSKGGVLLARGTYPSIRLYPDAHHGAMGGHADILGPVASYTDKLRIALPASCSGRQLPIRAVYQLGPDLPAGHDPRVEALSPRVACISLLRQAFAVDLRDPLQMWPILRFHGQLAASVPVFQLAYPRQFDDAPTVLSRLLEHVLRLADRASEIPA